MRYKFIFIYLLLACANSYAEHVGRSGNSIADLSTKARNDVKQLRQTISNFFTAGSGKALEPLNASVRSIFGKPLTAAVYVVSLFIGLIVIMAFYESPISPLPIPALPDPPVGRFPPEHPIWPPPPPPIRFNSLPQPHGFHSFSYPPQAHHPPPVPHPPFPPHGPIHDPYAAAASFMMPSIALPMSHTIPPQLLQQLLEKHSHQLHQDQSQLRPTIVKPPKPEISKPENPKPKPKPSSTPTPPAPAPDAVKVEEEPPTGKLIVQAPSQFESFVQSSQKFRPWSEIAEDPPTGNVIVQAPPQYESNFHPMIRHDKHIASEPVAVLKSQLVTSTS